MDVKVILGGLAFAIMWSSAFATARIIVASAPPLLALSLRFFLSGAVAIVIARAMGQSYPHQLSGGQRQRVMIAIALACNPKLLFADEPTTALDVTVQAQILQLLSDLRKELNMSMVLVTHDLGVVAGHTDKIAVMYAGEVVEYGETKELFANVRMPYTEALLNSIPRLDQKSSGRMTVIEGRLPDPTKPEPGCAFASRCPYVQDKCRTEHPELQQSENGHQFRCHFPLGVAK